MSVATNDTPSALHTRPSLLCRLRDRSDGESWQTFVSVYTPLVYSYARRRGLQDADAGDVAQDVLAEVLKSIQAFEYQPERGRFRDWLGTITSRQLSRVFARTGSCTLPDDLSTEAAAQEWSDEFTAHLLAVAMTRIEPHFEPNNWQAFRLAWQEHRPAADVAIELGISPAAVYVAKSRGLKRLREELLHLAEDLPQFVPL